MIHIAPSILAADFSRLGEQVLETERAGAGRIHVDVMDGHFVPNLSMGPVVVKGLRPRTRLPLEVHLMVQEPARFADSFLKEGADSLLVHIEVLQDPRPLLRQIRGRGKKAGLVVNPAIVESQIRGQLVQTASRMLHEEVTFDTSGVTSVDWRSYPVIHIDSIPETIEIVLIKRPEAAPSGAAEMALGLVPAAIGNAVFDATGVRLRRVPFTPERVKAALERA